MTVKWFLAQLPAGLPCEKGNAQATVFPRNTDELQDIIILANMTRTRLGFRPAINEICLNLSNLNQIKRHRNEEFLVTTETGLTLSQLSETIANKKQRFALAYSGANTLAHILSNNPPTLSASRFPALPHWVVGIEAFTGDGEYIHFGGEVVKNVTGYDMGKLFVGSHNQFGIITSATLKLVPEADNRNHVLLHTETMEQAMQLATWIQKSLKTTEILAVFRTKTTFGWHVLASFTGYADLVNEEAAVLKEAIAPLDKQLQELDMSDKTLIQWIQKLDWAAPDHTEALVIRVVGENDFLQKIASQISETDATRNTEMLIPYGSHQILLRWPIPNLPTESALIQLQATAAEWNGFVDIVTSPAGYLQQIKPLRSSVVDIWKARLKQQFDPHRVLPSFDNAGDREAVALD